MTALPPRPTAPAAPSTDYLVAIREDIAALAQLVQRPTAVQSDVRAAALGVFQAIGTLLAVRLLLMLALVGGFVLALMALRSGTYQAGGVLIAYAVLIVIPLIWLERNPRVGGANAA